MEKLTIKTQARLDQIGKTHQDVQTELLKRGYDVKLNTLDRWLVGSRKPKDYHISIEIDLIISCWEKEKGIKLWISSTKN